MGNSPVEFVEFVSGHVFVPLVLFVSTGATSVLKGGPNFRMLLADLRRERQKSLAGPRLKQANHQFSDGWQSPDVRSTRRRRSESSSLSRVVNSFPFDSTIGGSQPLLSADAPNSSLLPKIRTIYVTHGNNYLYLGRRIMYVFENPALPTGFSRHRHWTRPRHAHLPGAS